MGWYFSPQSRSELIAELIAPQQTERVSAKVIAHALRGNVLWSVVELTAKVEGVHRDPRRASPCATSAAICWNAAATSGATSRWKSPCIRTITRARCPIRDLAPEQSADWRAGVRAYHARRRTPTAVTAPAAALLA